MGDDAEAVRQAFAEFMLSGNKKKKGPATPSKKKTNVILQTPTSNKKETTPSSFQTPSKDYRKFQSIVKAFRGCLVRDFLEVNDNLEQVMESVSHLRERLWASSRLLARAGDRNYPTYYRHPANGGLEEADLQLTISHDLLQHEKMLQGLRRLLSALSQGHDALGRRLEELLIFAADHAIGETLGEDDATAQQELEECQDIYTAAAMELYRKQQLAEKVLDTVSDRLLAVQEETAFVGPNPRTVATQSAQVCSRKNSQSPLAEYAHLLRNIQEAVL